MWVVEKAGLSKKHSCEAKRIRWMVDGGASTVMNPRAQPSAISITEAFEIPIPVDTLSAPGVSLAHLRVVAQSAISTSELPCLTSLDYFPPCLHPFQNHVP